MIAPLLRCFLVFENIESIMKKRVHSLGLISHAMNPIKRRRRHHVENVREIEN